VVKWQKEYRNETLILETGKVIGRSQIERKKNSRKRGEQAVGRSDSLEGPYQKAFTWGRKPWAGSGDHDGRRTTA